MTLKEDTVLQISALYTSTYEFASKCIQCWEVCLNAGLKHSQASNMQAFNNGFVQNPTQHAQHSGNQFLKHARTIGAKAEISSDFILF